MVAMFITKILLDVEEEIHKKAFTYKCYFNFTNEINLEYDNVNIKQTANKREGSDRSPGKLVSANKKRFQILYFIIIEMLFFVLDVDYSLESPYMMNRSYQEITRTSSSKWENSDMKIWYYIQKQLNRTINVHSDFRPLYINKPKKD